MRRTHSTSLVGLCYRLLRPQRNFSAEPVFILPRKRAKKRIPPQQRRDGAFAEYGPGKSRSHWQDREERDFVSNHNLQQERSPPQQRRDGAFAEYGPGKSRSHWQDREERDFVSNHNLELEE